MRDGLREGINEEASIAEGISLGFNDRFLVGLPEGTNDGL